MKLKTYFGVYNLELIKDNYRNNNKPYFGLYDIEVEEPYADITVNLDLDPVYKDYNFIDWDFINFCFEYIVDYYYFTL